MIGKSEILDCSQIISHPKNMSAKAQIDFMVIMTRREEWTMRTCSKVISSLVDYMKIRKYWLTGIDFLFTVVRSMSTSHIVLGNLLRNTCEKTVKTKSITATVHIKLLKFTHWMPLASLN